MTYRSSTYTSLGENPTAQPTPGKYTNSIISFTNKKNEIEFVKVAKEANGNEKPLADAKFKLKKDNEYLENLEQISDKDGKVKWQGLSQGNYEVWETSAPDGYIKPHKRQ